MWCGRVVQGGCRAVLLEVARVNTEIASPSDTPHQPPVMPSPDPPRAHLSLR